MPSALDLLKKPEKQGKSAIDLLQQPKPTFEPTEEEPKRKSALDRIREDLMLSAPATEPPVSAVKQIAEGLRAEAGPEERDGFLTGGTFQEEFMRDFITPSRGEGNRYEYAPIVSDETKEAFLETSEEIIKLTGQPYDIAKGVAEFAIHGIPSFLMGLGFATEALVREGIPRLLGGGSILDVYNIASEGFMNAMKIAEPARQTLEESLEAPRAAARRLIGDKITEYTLGLPENVNQNLVAEIGMAPATGVSLVGRHFADAFENENVRGILYFATDAAALAALGKVYHGGRKKVVADFKGFEAKARNIIRRERELNDIPDSVFKRAEQAKLAAERKQMELEAQRIQDNLDYGQMIKEDLSSKTKRIEQIKQPAKEILDVQIDRAFEKATKEKPKKGEKKAEPKPIETDLPQEAIDGIQRIVDELGSLEGVENYYTSNTRVDRYALEYARRKYGEGETQLTPTKRGEEPPPPKRRKQIEATFKEMKSELGEVFDFIGESDLKKKRKFTIKIHDLEPGEQGKVPPTWHDGTFRFTVLKDANGQLHMGAAGSYDTILNTGAAAGGKGSLPPGSTAYIIDLGPYDSRVINIYRSPKTEVGPGGETKRISPTVKRRKKAKELPEETTDLDRQTGSRTPEELNSVFRETDSDVTSGMRKVYEELRHIEEDPELMVAKHLNDINYWLDGNKGVDATAAKNALSEIAVQAADQANRTRLLDYFEGDSSKVQNYIDFVGEAARWARQADRTKSEQSIRTTKGADGKLNIFIGVNAQMPKAVLQLFKKATTAFRSGMPLEAIRQKTGWFINPYDRKWRFEVSDREFRLTPGFLDRFKAGGGVMKAEDAFQHPTLFIAYPEIRNVIVKVEKARRPGDKGKYDPDTNTLTIYTEAENPRSIAVHELEHWIQFKEDFAVGGNVDTAIDYAGRGFLQRAAEKVLEQTRLNIGGYEKALRLTEKTYAKLNDIKSGADRVRLVERLTKRFNQGKEFDRVWDETRDMFPQFTEREMIDMFVEVRTIEARGVPNFAKLVDHYFNKGIRERGRLENERGLMYELETTTNIEGLRTTLKRIGARNFEAYKALAGEIEARDVQARLDMTGRERLQTQPYSSEEFNPREVNVVFKSDYGMDTAMSAARDVVRERRQSGQDLHSGVPLDRAARELVNGAKRLSEYTRTARGMKQFKPLAAAKAVREELVRSFIDRSGNIRQELLEKLGEQGYRIAQKMYLSKGSSALAANMLKQMRKEVYDGLTKHEKQVLDNLILAERMVDIGQYKTKKEFKFPQGLEPENSAAYSELFPYIEKISPLKADAIRQRAEAYYEWMKRPLQDMLDAQLISPEEFDALSSHNYRRIKLVDIYDQRYSRKVGEKKRTVYDSGVEALARGRETDIFEPSSEIMALEVFNRAYGRVLNNRANLELLQLAREQKENPFVRVRESKGDRIPSGWNRIFVYENGQRKALYLSPEMGKEWITNNPEMSYRMSQFMRLASGSPVLRTFATGINWGFALANLPRDVMHTWYAARTFEGGKWKPIYNSNLPVFTFQISRDLATVFSDAALRKGRYETYMKEGGGMEFLVHQGRILQRGRHLEGPLDSINNFLGYFGETSEIMTRLAIRERVLRKRAKEQGLTLDEARRNEVISNEATFAARDYMDFGQGGGLAKGMDNAIPYLNAAIQGTRGLLRSFKDNPARSTYKLAQFAALTTGLYVAARKMNPKTMDSLQGNIDMQNNLVIPLGDEFGFEDSEGQMRYPYLKVPLDPSQKFFKTFFEASVDKWLGYDVDVDRVVDSLKEQSPVGVTELPPSVSGVLGYITNKDFWLNEDIWRKTDKPYDWQMPKKYTGEELGGSEEEYIPGETPQAYIDLGRFTGLSPERTRYVVEELTTSGTVWSYLLGKGYEEAFGDLPKSKKEQHLAMALDQMPIVKRFFGVTNPYSQYAQSIDTAKEKSDIERWIQNRGLDMRVEAYLFDDALERKDVIKYIAETAKDKKTFDRLRERFEFMEKTKDLPNRSFWLRLKGLTVEARARVYVDRLRESGPEERMQLMKELATVIRAGGVVSKSFREEVSRLQAQ